MRTVRYCLYFRTIGNDGSMLSILNWTRRLYTNGDKITTAWFIFRTYSLVTLRHYLNGYIDEINLNNDGVSESFYIGITLQVPINGQRF